MSSNDASTSGGHGNAHLELFPVDANGNAPMATHVAVSDGDWFDPSTWESGKVPGQGALVHIPEDVEVSYDGASDANIFMVRVDGTLTFTAEDGGATKLVVDTIVASPDSTLNVLAARQEDGTVDIVFSEGKAAAHRSFYNDNSSNDGVIGRYDWDPEQLSLGLVSSGEVNVQGQEVAAHFQLETGPRAGATELVFDAWAEGADTWEPGQQIVVGAANYVNGDSQDEVRTITAIEVVGDRMIVHIDEALDYDHRGPQNPQTGEELTVSVGNLTRNVTFSSAVADQNGDGLADRGVSLGETAGANEHYVTERGHVMFMHTDDVDVSNSAFFGLGRTDKSVAIDDFVLDKVQNSDGQDVGHDQRVYEDNGEIGVYEEGIDIALTTAADELQNTRGRYALHLHRAGVGDSAGGHGHAEMDAEGGIVGPCARSGDPICHCGAIDEDGDGIIDYYEHEIGSDHGSIGEGEQVDLDGDGQADVVRHTAAQHRAFVEQQSSTNNTAQISGNVVWGSPGWGIVQHDSQADLIDNVTFDVRGAGIVSETGNETGLWQGNATFNTYGSETFVFDSGDTDFNDDFGKEGVGFWSQSRAIEFVDNVAISSSEAGFYLRGYGIDQIDVATSSLTGPLASLADGAEGISPEDVPIRTFVGNKVIASFDGLRIVTDPLDSVRKYNDAYSLLEDFTAWNVENSGVDVTYSSKYIFRDFLILGNGTFDAGGGATAGFQFRASVSDIIVHNAYVSDFTHGVFNWFMVGDRQEYRRGFWDPKDPVDFSPETAYSGIGAKYGIDNPIYNLWNNNFLNVEIENTAGIKYRGNRGLTAENAEGETQSYDALSIRFQSDINQIDVREEVDIRLIQDSAKGGLVALWREDLANAENYEEVLQNHIPLAYQDNILFSQALFENGDQAAREDFLDDGEGIAADIWSGTILEFVKTDSLGEQVFAYNDFSPTNPDNVSRSVTTNERIIFTREMIDGVLERDGFYTSPGSGLKFVAIKSVFTDRLTGEFTVKEFLVGLDLNWEIPDGARNNGLYAAKEYSVVANEYAYFRDGEILENWGTVSVEVTQEEEYVADEVTVADGLAILDDALADLGRFESGYGPDAFTGSDYNERLTAAVSNDQLSGADSALTGVRDDLGGIYDTAAFSQQAAQAAPEPEMVTITGTDSSDHLTGSDVGEVLKGLGADDLLEALGGDDRIQGGAGDDIISGGRGNDTMRGGAGADRFRFEGDSDDDVIEDFDTVEDVIELLGSGLDFEDIEITQDGEDALIGHSGNTIRLLNTNANDLDDHNVMVA